MKREATRLQIAWSGTGRDESKRSRSAQIRRIRGESFGHDAGSRTEGDMRRDEKSRRLGQR